MQRNLNLAHKILLNANNSNGISLLWAFRTHNFPFNPIPSSDINHFHNWRKNLINNILNTINDIIHNNKWICTLIHYTTIEQFLNMSQWNNLILIQQLKISIEKQLNTPPNRRAILVFIKFHFISQLL